MAARPGELIRIVALLCAVVLVHAASRLFFLHRSGQVRQTVLLDLRRRVFRHFQRLDIAFHDRYPSGRVVSRLTNDVEAIQDMLATGFDSLVNALLTSVGTAILLVVLDWRLGLVCLLAFPILVVLAGWFRSESAKTYRQVRESAALVIMQFVETMTGIKAVQAYRREPRNQEIFEDIADQYRAVNEKTFKLVAVFAPGVKLVGNVTVGVVLLYGGDRVLRGEMTIGTLAAFLLYLRMFFEPMQEITRKICGPAPGVGAVTGVAADHVCGPFLAPKSTLSCWLPAPLRASVDFGADHGKLGARRDLRAGRSHRFDGGVRGGDAISGTAQHRREPQPDDQRAQRQCAEHRESYWKS